MSFAVNVPKEKPEFVSPQKVLNELKLGEGDMVIDYGAGPGHWSIPAAKIVGPQGKVYAIDNNFEILNILESKAEVQGLKNIGIEELNLEKEEPNFKGKADLVIIANVLHFIEDKDRFIKRAVDVTKEKGRVLIIDWQEANMMFGPSKKLRMKEEDVITICENAGLNLVCSVDAGWHHFGLVFKN